MKNLSRVLKHLEKRKIITKKPNPIIPFILGLAFLIIIRIASINQINNTFL
ncbi:unnamed protein product, partial [marine sediment metagenome]